MSFFSILDILGTFAFAISGALSAMNRKMDLFGVFIIAFVTAIGGGTLRDVLIGNTPVNWMKQPLTMVYIAIAVLIAILFRNKINYLKKSLFLFDTIGLGIFTIIGIQIGIRTDLSPIVSITLGIMTGCFGGVIRDILCNEIPVIFRKEIYAIASLVGGISYFLLQNILTNIDILYSITAAIIIVIRLLVVKYHISLPIFSVTKNNGSQPND